jgi:hypothetical protein
MGRLCAVVLAVLLLAACSGGAASTAGSPPSATQIASQLGATGVQSTEPTLYAYSEATGTLHGKTVDIATFRTSSLRDKWIAAASQFTGIEQKGPLYAVADG